MLTGGRKVRRCGNQKTAAAKAAAEKREMKKRGKSAHCVDKALCGKCRKGKRREHTAKSAVRYFS